MSCERKPVLRVAARGLLLGLATLTCGAGPDIAEQDCEPQAPVVEIAPGLFVRPGRQAVVFEQDGIANIGFVIGERCVAVIDTGGSVEEGRALDCAIRSRTALPVCYVINSHAHPDHILGNLAFAGRGAQFVGHARLPRAMAMLGGVYLRRAAERAGRPLGPEHVVLPGTLVERQLELDLGGRTLQLRAHASAHTDHDLSVYDAQTQTLWLADLLFVGHVPVLDASVNGWLTELDALAEHAAQRAVPGHGPVQVGWPAGARDTLRYLGVLREETREWIARGGQLRAAQQRLGRSEARRWQLFDSYHERNISAAYRELEWED